MSIHSIRGADPTVENILLALLGWLQLIGIFIRSFIVVSDWLGASIAAFSLVKMESMFISGWNPQ